LLSDSTPSTCFRRGRIEQARTTISRARSDYLTWIEHRQEQMLDEFGEIDDGHASRGVYDSGMRLTARELARKALRDLEQRQEQTESA
jgi:hypothetical protein